MGSLYAKLLPTKFIKTFLTNKGHFNHEDIMIYRT